MWYCHPSSLHQLVSAVFVHAQSRRQYAAPHKRNARQFKKALHRPILPILTMKDGKGGVQTNLLHSPLSKYQESRFASVRQHHGGSADFRVKPSVIFDILNRPGVGIPVAHF